MKKQETKSIDEVINALQAGERQYKAFKEGVDIANEIKSLMGSKTELQGFVEKALSEKALLDAELDKAKDDVKKAKSEAKKVRDEMVEKANLLAEKVINEAKTKAGNLLKDAQNKADAIDSNSKAVSDELLEKEAKVSALTAEIDKAEKAKAKLLNALGA